MNLEVLQGILIPFIGSTLGAAMVFILVGALSDHLGRMLSGFAAGIMVSASFWSLLQPALENAQSLGKWAFVPVAIGFMVGISFLLLLDHITPHMHLDRQEEGPHAALKRTTKLVLAVTLHNIPEGMAVGVVYAGWLAGTMHVSQTAALVLALGIAIQNFPEGAIVSLSLRTEGVSTGKAFVYGTLSGIVEPIAALITLIATSVVTSILPVLLAFAAGAMMYVVVEELIPEMSEGKHSNIGTVAFALGFTLMMVLDVALG